MGSEHKDLVNQMLTPPSWAAQRRQEFIDLALFWHGQINREDLRRRFDISLQQASADLRTYRDMAGEGLKYDGSRKTYVTTAVFKPSITEPSADRLLMQFTGALQGLVRERDLFVHQLPDLDLLPVPRRTVDNKVLRAALQGIAGRRSLVIKYESLSSGTSSERKISPHALATDHFRWHMRAYCHSSNMFKDFVLTRITSACEAGASQIDPSSDAAWTTWIDVEIGPHSGLSETQRRAIEIDYQMQDSVAVLRVRAAMMFYLKQQMHWGTETTRDPATQQVRLVNRDAVDAQLRAIGIKLFDEEAHHHA